MNLYLQTHIYRTLIILHYKIALLFIILNHYKYKIVIMQYKIQIFSNLHYNESVYQSVNTQFMQYLSLNMRLISL